MSYPRPDLIKDSELSAEWQISTKTLANKRSRGEGPPFVRIGRTIRYSRSACAEWLAAQQDDVLQRGA
jgi:predicted DNA-binding transcriptional regulator AlpA